MQELKYLCSTFFKKSFESYLKKITDYEKAPGSFIFFQFNFDWL